MPIKLSTQAYAPFEKPKNIVSIQEASFELKEEKKAAEPTRDNSMIIITNEPPPARIELTCDMSEADPQFLKRLSALKSKNNADIKKVIDELKQWGQKNNVWEELYEKGLRDSHVTEFVTRFENRTIHQWREFGDEEFGSLWAEFHYGQTCRLLQKACALLTENQIVSLPERRIIYRSLIVVLLSAGASRIADFLPHLIDQLEAVAVGCTYWLMKYRQSLARKVASALVKEHYSIDMYAQVLDACYEHLQEQGWNIQREENIDIDDIYQVVFEPSQKEFINNAVKNLYTPPNIIKWLVQQLQMTIITALDCFIEKTAKKDRTLKALTIVMNKCFGLFNKSAPMSLLFSFSEECKPNDDDMICELDNCKLKFIGLADFEKLLRLCVTQYVFTANIIESSEPIASFSLDAENTLFLPDSDPDYYWVEHTEINSTENDKKEISILPVESIFDNEQHLQKIPEKIRKELLAQEIKNYTISHLHKSLAAYNPFYIDLDGFSKALLPKEIQFVQRILFNLPVAFLIKLLGHLVSIPLFAVWKKAGNFVRSKSTFMAIRIMQDASSAIRGLKTIVNFPIHFLATILIFVAVPLPYVVIEKIREVRDAIVNITNTVLQTAFFLTSLSASLVLTPFKHGIKYAKKVDDFLEKKDWSPWIRKPLAILAMPFLSIFVGLPLTIKDRYQQGKKLIQFGKTKYQFNKTRAAAHLESGSLEHKLCAIKVFTKETAQSCQNDIAVIEKQLSTPFPGGKTEDENLRKDFKKISSLLKGVEQCCDEEDKENKEPSVNDTTHSIARSLSRASSIVIESPSLTASSQPPMSPPPLSPAAMSLISNTSVAEQGLFRVDVVMADEVTRDVVSLHSPRVSSAE